MSVGRNTDDWQGRAIKRRKLYHPLNMAQSEHSDSLNEDPSVLPLKAGGIVLESRSTTTRPVSAEIRTGNREDLMTRLNRGEQPTWVAPPSIQADHTEARLSALDSDALPSEALYAVDANSSMLRPAVQQIPIDGSQPEQETDIQRTRSALHRGDFADSSSDGRRETRLEDLFRRVSALSTSPDFGVTPRQWLADSAYASPLANRLHASTSEGLGSSTTTRRRAPSVGTGLSSSYVFRIPTSPLVQASTHSYLDMPASRDSVNPTHAARDSSRRRTMPPNLFHSFSVQTSEPSTPNFSRPFSASLRREVSMPIHTHRSRPSLSSLTYQPMSNSQSFTSRSRRPSQASDSASRRRTSMVISFEESLLRGTMSTPASKPLEFVAQIGVMGKGECTASLKCPPHVTVSFPAVFYSYPAVPGSRSISDDTPSPYVGRIDLEQNLKSVTLAASKTKRSSAQHSGFNLDKGEDTGADTTIRLGGSYRVPKQGQLQIIIKNPNATAVKLFLVPYDLEGMPANTKTFVRQRSFSSGAVAEEALTQSGPKAAAINSLESKTILRYLIHVKFCSPSKNRFYLYDDIRVVFANRVPDGKEKLRNEIQLPEPKFTSWKPGSAVLKHQSEKDVFETPHDLSSEVGISPSSWTPYEVDNFYPRSPSLPRTLRRSPSPYVDSPPSKDTLPRTTTRPIDSSPIPLHFSHTLQDDLYTERSITPVKGFQATTSPRASPLPWSSPSAEVETSRNYLSAHPQAPGSGLISQQFQELDKKKKKERQRMRDILSGESGSSEETSP